ncbi:MAG: glycosyltransferase family 4 protein [Litoreibacter sp.]|uniref:glycosyltransferase family 4 protein n=1 Tax=Litoreibacter sp. TaxID=1969459 RepID=UPI003297CCD3
MKKVFRKLLPASRIAPSKGEDGLSLRDSTKTVLDQAFYRARNPDVVKAGIDVPTHYIRYGIREGRASNPWTSLSYIRSALHQDTHKNVPEKLTYLRSNLSQKPRLIFVSHDATRTGAPAIILRLLDMFSKSGAFECFTILDQGGERLPEFEALSHTYVMSRSRRDRGFSDAQAIAEISAFFGAEGIFEDNKPVCALVNSAESIRIGQALSSVGIPIISLLHEIAAYYPTNVFEQFSEFSKKTVFPSQFVSDAAERHCKPDMTKTTVRGQGLLEDGFGELDRETCRTLLRDALDLPEDAFIVLNVGTRDIRKGADLFVDLAKLFLDQNENQRPVYFVWFGNPDKTFGYPAAFIARHGLQGRVRMMPGTSQIEQVFMGGDLFLLTARADPFPCVIHEAMACALPVVAFNNGGGAPELIGDDCGATVEMNDLAQASRIIQNYVDDPDLSIQQGQKAKAKIAENWDYLAYQRDIYTMIKECAGTTPDGGWPKADPPQPVEHLVVMNGLQRDLDILNALDIELNAPGCEVMLIDGRFGQDVDAVVETLREQDVVFRVCQPMEDTEAARSTQLLDHLHNPKPYRLTLINTLSYLDADRLQVMSIPTEAIVTAEALELQQLYARIPYLNRLHLANNNLARALFAANPASTSKVELI